jgi:hypothetical protein
MRNWNSRIVFPDGTQERVRCILKDQAQKSLNIFRHARSNMSGNCASIRTLTRRGRYLSSSQTRAMPTSATGLDVFDRTTHLTNTWLDEMMQTLPRDKQVAWHAPGAVLRTIRTGSDQSRGASWRAIAASDARHLLRPMASERDAKLAIGGRVSCNHRQASPASWRGERDAHHAHRPTDKRGGPARRKPA